MARLSPGLPPRILLLHEIAGPRAEPGVALAPLLLDLRQLIADDTVPSREDRAVGADFIEPGPASVWKLRAPQPRDGPVDRTLYCGGRRLPHQEADDPRRL